MTPSRRLSSCALAAATSLAAPAAAHAGGLFLPGNGSVSAGRAGASVASIDDPTAISINPAGLAGIPGTMISLGMSLVDYHLTFDRNGTYDDVPDRTDPWEGTPYAPVSDESTPPIGLGSFQIVPVLAVSHSLEDQVKGLTVALGVFAPQAYPTRKMGADYLLARDEATVAPPPSRYDVVDQKAAVVLPSIAAAYRINDKLDLGGRFSWGFADVEAKSYVWAVPNFDEWAGKDSLFHLHTKDNFIPAFGLGVRYRPMAHLELGAAWSSALHVRSSGTGDAQQGSGNELGGMPITVVPIADDLARCAKGGTADALKACLDLDLPQTASLGGRYVMRDGVGRESADVELDVQWENWGAEAEGGRAAADYAIIIDAAGMVGNTPIALNESRIRHNFKDTFSVRLGGSWHRDVGSARLTLRGGVAHDTAAARSNWERADVDGAARTAVALGASYGMKKVRFDVGGGLVIEPTRDQGTTCNGNAAGNDPNCAGGDRNVTGPDPTQPAVTFDAQAQSPIAAGNFESGYVILMLGATTWF